MFASHFFLIEKVDIIVLVIRHSFLECFFIFCPFGLDSFSKKSAKVITWTVQRTLSHDRLKQFHSCEKYYYPVKKHEKAKTNTRYEQNSASLLEYPAIPFKRTYYHNTAWSFSEYDEFLKNNLKKKIGKAFCKRIKNARNQPQLAWICNCVAVRFFCARATL